MKEYGGIGSTRMGKGGGWEARIKGAKFEGLTQGNIIMYFLKILKLGNKPSYPKFLWGRNKLQVERNELLESQVSPRMYEYLCGNSHHCGGFIHHSFHLHHVHNIGPRLAMHSRMQTYHLSPFSLWAFWALTMARNLSSWVQYHNPLAINSTHAHN